MALADLVEVGWAWEGDSLHAAENSGESPRPLCLAREPGWRLGAAQKSSSFSSKLATGWSLCARQAVAIAWPVCLFVLLGDLTAQLFQSMQWSGLSHSLYSRDPGCSSLMNLPARAMPSPERGGMSSRGEDFNSHNPVFQKGGSYFSSSGFCLSPGGILKWSGQLEDS